MQDFHSSEAAAAAEVNWSKQFQKDEVPEDIPTVTIQSSQVYVKDTEVAEGGSLPYYPLFDFKEIAHGAFVPRFRLDKIIALANLCSSNSEAGRKLKERAVRIDGVVVAVNQIAAFLPKKFVLGVGRRLINIELVK